MAIYIILGSGFLKSYKTNEIRPRKCLFFNLAYLKISFNHVISIEKVNEMFYKFLFCIPSLVSVVYTQSISIQISCISSAMCAGGMLNWPVQS